MKGIRIHTGIAAPLMRDNIDTDQIIPSREMKTVSKQGLGDGLFAGQRYLKAGSREPNPDFILNKPEFSGTSILLSGKNFGCGSSREHAVWALKEFGIRIIIAESFGEIFFNNCVRNMILPIQLTSDEIKSLEGHYEIIVDLPAQSISAGALKLSFEIAPANKEMIIGGLDAIDLTQDHSQAISDFLKTDASKRPWVYNSI